MGQTKLKKEMSKSRKTESRLNVFANNKSFDFFHFINNILTMIDVCGTLLQAMLLEVVKYSNKKTKYTFFLHELPYKKPGGIFQASLSMFRGPEVWL